MARVVRGRSSVSARSFTPRARRMTCIEDDDPRQLHRPEEKVVTDHPRRRREWEIERARGAPARHGQPLTGLELQAGRAELHVDGPRPGPGQREAEAHADTAGMRGPRPQASGTA